MQTKADKAKKIGIKKGYRWEKTTIRRNGQRESVKRERMNKNENRKKE